MQVFSCKFSKVFRKLFDRATMNDYEKRLHFESLKETYKIWKALKNCKLRVTGESHINFCTHYVIMTQRA